MSQPRLHYLVTTVVLVLTGLLLLGLVVTHDAEWAQAIPSALKDAWSSWQDMALTHPWWFAIGYFGLFSLLSAAALPGCAPMALMASSAFGWVGGTLMVGSASTVGAVLAFLLARHGFRQRVIERFGHRLAPIESAMTNHANLLVFWLRLVPLVPYPLLNPLLGLTTMSLMRFALPSWLGLTLGSIPYVVAGASVHQVLMFGLTSEQVIWGLVGVVLMGCTWWFTRRWGLRQWQMIKQQSEDAKELGLPNRGAHQSGVQEGHTT